MIREWRHRKHIERFGHKNKGYFNYFTFDWFRKHQRVLLFLLNTPVIRIWFRWAMRMHNDPEVKGKKIASFEPNGYRIRLNDSEMQYVVRTHAKYSKRVYYSFWAVWWVMHWIDALTRALLPQPLAESINFGFDTLTVYPDADPEVNSCDGAARRNDAMEAFATVRNGAGSAFEDNLQTVYVNATSHATSSNNYRAIGRGLFGYYAVFAGTITGASATFNTYLTSTSLWDDDSYLICNNGSFTTALSASDYAISEQGNKASDDAYLISDFNTAKTFTLNSDGLAHINNNGITRFSLMTGNDYDNSPGTWLAGSSAFLQVWCADGTGTSNDPYLTIIYGNTSGGQSQMVI